MFNNIFKGILVLLENIAFTYSKREVINLRGKSIKLYIMGEFYKNLKTAELSNWVGKALIGERKHIESLKKIDDTATTGVYFLVRDEDTSYQKKIYIGEADDIRERLSTHEKNKDWWDRFVVFISKDSNLTKSHVRYLEKELYSIAKANLTTIQLDNKNEPSGSKLPQSDIDDMDEFQENILFILKNLGIMDFTKLKLNNNVSDKDKDNNQTQDSPMFLLTVPGIEKNDSKIAYLKIIDDSYVLLKGSHLKKDSSDKVGSHNYFKLRQSLDKEGLFNKTECATHYILNKDIEFKSPSAAAAIVRNASMNGRLVWKLENGKTLGAFEQE